MIRIQIMVLLALALGFASASAAQPIHADPYWYCYYEGSPNCWTSYSDPYGYNACLAGYTYACTYYYPNDYNPRDSPQVYGYWYTPYPYQQPAYVRLGYSADSPGMSEACATTTNTTPYYQLGWPYDPYGIAYRPAACMQHACQPIVATYC